MSGSDWLKFTACYEDEWLVELRAFNWLTEWMVVWLPDWLYKAASLRSLSLSLCSDSRPNTELAATPGTICGTSPSGCYGNNSYSSKVVPRAIEFRGNES